MNEYDSDAENLTQTRLFGKKYGLQGVPCFSRCVAHKKDRPAHEFGNVYKCDQRDVCHFSLEFLLTRIVGR